MNPISFIESIRRLDWFECDVALLNSIQFHSVALMAMCCHLVAIKTDSTNK